MPDGLAATMVEIPLALAQAYREMAEAWIDGYDTGTRDNA